MLISSPVWASVHVTEKEHRPTEVLGLMVGLMTIHALDWARGRVQLLDSDLKHYLRDGREPTKDWN